MEGFHLILGVDGNKFCNNPFTGILSALIVEEINNRKKEKIK